MNRANRIILSAVVIAQLFFLVDARALFPQYWAGSAWSVWLPIYLALSLGTLVLAGYVGGNLGDPLGLFPLGIVYFAFGLMAMLLLFQIPFLRVPLNVPQGDATAEGAFTVLVVAPTEELMFRWFLIGLLQPMLKWWSVPLSAAAWTMFHLAAYGEQPTALLEIFLLGLLFGVVYLATRKFGGIGATWGAHAGWNLAVAGLFSVVH